MNRLFKKKGIEYKLDYDIKKIIRKWLRKNKFKKKDFGLILKELGFEPDKKVIFMKNIVSNGRISLFYWIDGESSYDKNRMITLLNPNGIELRDGNTLVSYECYYDKNKDNKVRLEEDHNKYWIEGKAVSYSRNIFYDKDGDTINIVVKYDKLDQCINIDIRYDDRFRTNFKINNEKELMEYLMDLTFPLSIDKVYKMVREISFDIDLYSKIVVSNVSVKNNSFSKVEYLCNRNSETINVLDKDRNVEYIRESNDSEIDFCMVSDNIEISLKIVEEHLDCRGMRLNNEEEIVEYLMNLDYPLSIDKVYKDIYRISLGDVCEYSKVLFQCSDILNNGKVTDMFILEDGNLEKFGMTKNGKTMFINKDGSFRYQVSDTVSDIDLSIMPDNRVKYEVVSNNDMYDDYNNLLITYCNISDARSEKEKIKRLVKRVFNKDKKDSN